MMALSEAPVLIAPSGLPQGPVWMCRSFFNAPASMDADVKCLGWNAVFFGDKRGRATVRHFAHKAPVVGLNLIGRPCTVIWAVISIYVDALNRQFRRISVCQGPIPEGHKILPFWANSNSAPTVISVSGAGRPFAPSAHKPPYVVEPRSRLPMSARAVAYFSILVAPAANRLSLSQVRAKNGTRCSTIANRVPNRTASGRVSRLLADRPKAIAAAFHIYQSRIFCHAK